MRHPPEAESEITPNPQKKGGHLKKTEATEVTKGFNRNYEKKKKHLETFPCDLIQIIIYMYAEKSRSRLFEIVYNFFPNSSRMHTPHLFSNIYPLSLIHSLSLLIFL